MKKRIKTKHKHHRKAAIIDAIQRLPEFDGATDDGTD